MKMHTIRNAKQISPYIQRLKCISNYTKLFSQNKLHEEKLYANHFENLDQMNNFLQSLIFQN